MSVNVDVHAGLEVHLHALTPFILWDSFRKLSSPHMRDIEAFVQPSSALTCSISFRRGWAYSGLAARW